MSGYRDITFEEVAAEFTYDPEEGDLFRFRGAPPFRFVGGVGGLAEGEIRRVRMVKENTTDRGYDSPATVGLRGHYIYVTHICFMLIEKRWPKPRHHMDHKDGDVWNCRWKNLREATTKQSSRNRGDQPRWSFADTSGLERGVYRHGKRYRVQLSVDGRSRYMGLYATLAEANAIARQKREELHGEFLFEASRKPPEES